jgi:hypothetical protein
MAAANPAGSAAELVAWVRQARPNQSFGALPPHLKAYVQSMGLPQLRLAVTADVEERVACIKRREQNQRALETRRARRDREVAAVHQAVGAYRLHAELLASFLATVEEHDEIFEDASFELFTPGASAAQLYASFSNGRPASAPPRMDAHEDDELVEHLRLFESVLSELPVEEPPARKRARCDAASDG